jgi:hypothetical protein
MAVPRRQKNVHLGHIRDSKLKKNEPKEIVRIP